MLNLEKIMQLVRGNQTKAAKFLGLNRGSFSREYVKPGKGIVVIKGKVYKEVSKINIDAFDEIELMKLREQFEMECNIR